MKVLVYVEGPSDRFALEKLLKPIIEIGQRNQTSIKFFPLRGKDEILKHCGRKAADELSSNPDNWIFALPDLHPMAKYDGTDLAHRSFEALERVLRAKFEVRASELKLPEAVRSHFRIHCLKHDLEALLLAVPDTLRERLGTKHALTDRWSRPVENQNGDKPPKRIVEELFKQYCKHAYSEATDAPWILERASLDTVLSGCKQRFVPFVTELKSLAAEKRLS